MSPGRTTNHPNILNIRGNRKGKIKEGGSGTAEGGMDLDHQILVNILCKAREENRIRNEACMGEDPLPQELVGPTQPRARVRGLAQGHPGSWGLRTLVSLPLGLSCHLHMLPSYFLSLSGCLPAPKIAQGTDRVLRLRKGKRKQMDKKPPERTRPTQTGRAEKGVS